jgi:Na+-translocating ferredoxin:NAD+ oxidoreductase subunit B
MSTTLVTTLFMAGIGVVASVVLIIASRFFSVPSDPRVEAVMAALPGVNCGACGYSGCAGAAAAVVRGERGPDVCLIGSREVTDAVARIMQVDGGSEKKRKRAYLRCGRSTREAGSRFDCVTPQDCHSAVMLYGGDKICSGGCIGYGTCSVVCPVEAIEMKSGLPVIDPRRCTGCGICVKECPKKIIALIDDTPQEIEKKRCSEYCMRKEVFFKVDQEKCIKCGICFKNCPVDAISWEKGSAAYINKENCIGCLTCLRLCPPGVIS